MKPVFIDIGSHDGRELKIALSSGYEVHAFEPNPNMKVDLEPYEKEATINYAAAWNEDVSSLKLYKRVPGDSSDQGVSLIKEKENISHDDWYEVPAINIGLYLKRLNKDIDILKIDTEGAEYYIIESILDHFGYKRIKHWLVEDHENRILNPFWKEHKGRILQKLKEYNIDIIPWLDDSQLKILL